MSILSLISIVLRDPASLIERAEDPDVLAEVAPKLLAILIGGAAVFGLVIGSWRGGIQLAYAAIKMPALFLIPLIVGLPAIKALGAAADYQVSWSRLGIAGLAGGARAAVLGAALGPVLWLMYSVTFDYHAAVLLLAGALGMVGLPGLASIGLAMPNGKARALTAIGAVAVLGLTTMQTGWLLRPFIARPTVEVAFLRPVEEDIFSALSATTQSATGNYPEWEAEGSGLMGRGLQQRGGR